MIHFGASRVTGDATPSDDLGDANGNLLSRLLFGICTLERVTRKPQSPSFRCKQAAAIDSFADCSFGLPKSTTAKKHPKLTYPVALKDYDALRRDYCRCVDDPGPRGLRRRLRAKNGRRSGFAGRAQYARRLIGARRAGCSAGAREPTRQSNCPGRLFRSFVKRAARRRRTGSNTTGGPGFGFEHFKQYDFLREKEVVLTFDDGPWPQNTPAVLKALADECLKATFFEIGEHATWHPEITKQVIEAGMTVATHTWSHKDLAKNPYASDIEKAKQEIEMGFSAVHMAAGVLVAPFFRFPDLQHPPQLLAYLSERNIASFSTDIDSFDFKIRKGEQVVKSVMTKLETRGKGIILMHDFQHSTAEGLPELIRQLKAGGYRVVHMVPRQPLSTLPKYDDMVTQLDKLSSNNTRPASSVVHTIAQ